MKVSAPELDAADASDGVAGRDAQEPQRVLVYPGDQITISRVGKLNVELKLLGPSLSRWHFEGPSVSDLLPHPTLVANALYQRVHFLNVEARAVSVMHVGANVIALATVDIRKTRVQQHLDNALGCAANLLRLAAHVGLDDRIDLYRQLEQHHRGALSQGREPSVAFECLGENCCGGWGGGWPLMAILVPILVPILFPILLSGRLCK